MPGPQEGATATLGKALVKQWQSVLDGTAIVTATGITMYVLTCSARQSAV